MARATNLQSRSLWHARLAQFSNSQKTVHEFCWSIGCSVATFYYWKRKLAADAPPKTPSQSIDSSFIPVTLRGPSSKRLRFQLPGGTRLSVLATDTATIAMILDHDRRGSQC
jgi:hypothetical protein